ncbi:MAG TPA: hypothetical protein VN851_05435 [Thermoanaerobaculia bacterium]|nr:hypothetical protein [Thermoanaerobaculia bacterium]
MIRVRKPAMAPGVLAGRGRAEDLNNRALYEREPVSYDGGAATFSFDSSIYGDPSVKSLLIEAQHGKCAFCESKIQHIAYGDVEHFRPKAGYRQHEDDPLGRPGYYWLAYDWSNLYLACQLCNQRYKKNLFPLLDDRLRCRNHLGDLTQEQPSFVDPGGVDDPRDHIEFEAEQPRARNGSLEGAATIQALGLMREELRERRFDRYRMLATLKNVTNLLPGEEEGREAARILADSVQDRAEYASMARSLMVRMAQS